MPSRLADRLSAARRGRFVGRAAEREVYLTALREPELPFSILYVFGPGGVGKTALLGEFARLSGQMEVPAFYLDARNLEPTPDGFLHALCLALGSEPSGSTLETLAFGSLRSAILIDTYEALSPLDEWLREVFLPQLPDNVLVVLASRHPPSPAWRADPGWQTLVRALPLRNLSPDESREYLARREVPTEHHQALLDFTHGHALALSLVADVLAQRPGSRFQPEAAPDVVRTLLEQFVQKVPGPAHRTALEACAMVRLTTEALLAATLSLPDAHELFDWLRGLSFVESGPRGVFPHDLARETLAADLRWRNPDWYAELHRRARTYYTARLQQTRGDEQQRILLDYVYLHRENPLVRPFFEWQGGASALIDSAWEGDWARVREMVAQHEGEEAAGLAEYWCARQPEGLLVVREGERLAGMIGMVALSQVSPAERDRDPAVSAAWRYLEQHAPLRPGESATLFRFWMARDTYQAVSSIQSLIFVNMVRHYLTAPGLAYSFLPCADPEFWAPGFAYADLARIPEADFEIGGRRYGVYGHDWRTVPPVAWLALLAEREIAAAPTAPPPVPPMEPLVVLSEPGFAAAVRAALRDAARPAALHGNPLLRSRLIVERVGAAAGTAPRVTALQAVLRQAVDALQISPREVGLYRALYHTYILPAPTQEQAAELLDLPFSTFRRHLKAGIGRVVAVLWQWELQGSGL